MIWGLVFCSGLAMDAAGKVEGKNENKTRYFQLGAIWLLLGAIFILLLKKL